MIRSANKERSFGLYSLALSRIKDLENGSRVISYPSVFQKLCRSFSIDKKACWELLFIMRDFGYIELISGHGIKIKVI